MNKLAIYGGEPVRTEKWQPWPFFDQDEVQSVVNVLQSGRVNYWTGEIIDNSGIKYRGFCGQFEQNFNQYLGVNHSICLANGTLSLELCLHALSIGKGDEVIVPNRTFIATASACVAQGAIPVFADIDLETQGLSIETIKSVVTDKTKAIICVHLAGRACEMDEIMDFARKNNIKVIEDCAQSIGGKYKGKMLGTIGDMSSFSFCQDKIMTTGGEGGMVATNDPDLFIKAWEYKDHGKNFHFFSQAIEHPLLDPEKKESGGMYSSVGTNFRMTEMQAAIGVKQLEKMPSWTNTRREHAHKLEEGLNCIDGIEVPELPEHIYHAYYKFYAFLSLDKLKPGWTRKRIVSAISSEGVVCQFGSTWGIGLEQGWKNTNIVGADDKNLQLRDHFPNDYKIGTTALMFQVHPTLDEQSINDTIEAVEKVMSYAMEKSYE